MRICCDASCRYFSDLYENRCKLYQRIEMCAYRCNEKFQEKPVNICYNTKCRFFDESRIRNCCLCCSEHSDLCMDAELSYLSNKPEKPTNEEPVYEYVEVGEEGRDDQLGNYYNAIDDLTSFFIEERDTDAAKMAHILRIYAEGLEE